MAQGVVDVLEMVQVDEQHGQLGIALTDALQAL